MHGIVIFSSSFTDSLLELQLILLCLSASQNATHCYMNGYYIAVSTTCAALIATCTHLSLVEIISMSQPGLQADAQELLIGILNSGAVASNINKLIQFDMVTTGIVMDLRSIGNQFCNFSMIKQYYINAQYRKPLESEVYILKPIEYD